MEKSKKHRVETVTDVDLKAEALAEIERFEKELSELEAAMAGELEYEELSRMYERKVMVSNLLDEVMEIWVGFE